MKTSYKKISEEEFGNQVAEFPKNDREVYRIYTREYKGYHLVDIRVWWVDSVTGEYHPGKGVSLKREILPDVVQVLSSLLEGTPEAESSS